MGWGPAPTARALPLQGGCGSRQLRQRYSAGVTSCSLVGRCRRRALLARAHPGECSRRSPLRRRSPSTSLRKNTPCLARFRASKCHRTRSHRCSLRTGSQRIGWAVLRIRSRSHLRRSIRAQVHKYIGGSAPARAAGPAAAALRQVTPAAARGCAAGAPYLGIGMLISIVNISGMASRTCATYFQPDIVPRFSSCRLAVDIARQLCMASADISLTRGGASPRNPKSGRRVLHLAARRGAAVTRRPGPVTRGALRGPGSPPRHITSMQHAAKGWLGTHFKDHLIKPARSMREQSGGRNGWRVGGGGGSLDEWRKRGRWEQVNVQAGWEWHLGANQQLVGGKFVRSIVLCAGSPAGASCGNSKGKNVHACRRASSGAPKRSVPSRLTAACGVHKKHGTDNKLRANKGSISAPAAAAGRLVCLPCSWLQLSVANNQDSRHNYSTVGAASTSSMYIQGPGGARVEGRSAATALLGCDGGCRPGSGGWCLCIHGRV